MKKADREKIFNKCGGRCAYCGHELDNTWQVDHMISKRYWFIIDHRDPKAINRMDNLMPSCVVCNHYKRSLCVDSFYKHTGFRNYMLSFHTRLAKLPKKTTSPNTQKRKEYMMRIAERYNITVETPFSGMFYFELTNPAPANPEK